MPALLLELFSEEIPARMQTRAAEDLKKLVTDHMVEAGLTYAGGRAFATPRRLVLALSGLPTVTPDTVEERKGPRTDAPEKALAGFLRSTGLEKDQLEVRDDKKGQVYFAVMKRQGRPAADVIAEAVEHAVRNFPWPKSMRWGVGTLRWVRPLHSILCVLSDEAWVETVPLEIDGIRAGDVTYGHRFHAPAPIKVSSFDDYAAKLETAKVILDPAERVARIEADAQNLAFAQGMEVVADKGLLAEVAGLVEWPVTLMGEIGEEFLDLPPEVLQTSMKEHQKFFSVRNPKSGRIERFITVANTQAADGGATILAGNGKVLAARLSDAKFFWENDMRTVKAGGMAALAEPLKSVTFHNKLGTQWERIERVAALAAEIAPSVGADPEAARQAAMVCKADLSSQMVYEFPELQGIMGRYYAEHAGLAAEIAAACEAHYAPLGPSDDVPSETISVAVALADKIDMLTGFWAIDEKPTGSKDPFALRRAALGIIRTVLETNVRIMLLPLLGKRISGHTGRTGSTDEYDIVETAKNALVDAGEVKLAEEFFEQRARAAIDNVYADQAGILEQIYSKLDDLLSFLADRLKTYLRDQGIRHDVIQACFDLGGQDDLVLLVNRVRALQAFVDTEDGANLLAGYTRASNIVAAEEKKDGVEYSGGAEEKFAEQDEERALFAALDSAEPAIANALEAEDFTAAMGEMAKLRAPIDAFFDQVTVNADNQIVRRNRLCLLTRVRQVMRQVAVWEAIEG
ncbi:MAG: glycine--tRNA ligase subunit beta [Paracoccaceae bacterium]